MLTIEPLLKPSSCKGAGDTVVAVVTSPLKPAGKAPDATMAF